MNHEQQAIARISREVVAGAAPGELPMFRAQSAAFFADPELALEQVKSKDEMLGFGVGDAAGVLTPVVMLLVSTAVSFVITEVRKSLRGEAASVIATWLKALVAPTLPALPAASTALPAPLSREQMDRLRLIAIEKARNYVDAEQADRLADELVGRFVAG